MLKRVLRLWITLCAMILALSPCVCAEAIDRDTYCIEVDITNQITTVYRSSDRSIARQMICSTGTGTKTPLGEFRLEQSRKDTDRVEWYYISKYQCYVKYATRIKGSILFHSIPYSEKDMGSIDDEALSQLGTKASHGCIRLRWEDARWIAENCPDGTTVRIFNGAAKKTALRQLLLVEGYTVDRGESYDQFLDYNATDRDLVRLGRGSDGESVAALQRRLAGLGFFSGSITGRYDEATIVAVMRYQSAIGTTVNGIAGEALVERIMGEEDAVAEYATLSPGQTGTLVSKYQRALQALGFYGGAIDGVYGDDLAASIRTYCECLGLPATGEVTPAMRLRTYELLEHLDNRFGRGNYAMLLLDDDRTVARSRKDAPIYDESSVSGRRLTTVPDNRSVRLLRTGRRWCVVEYNGVTGYVPTSKLHISRKKQMTAHWGTPVTRLGVADMASGSIGDGVGDLQDRLRALGFYSGSTTALYDDETAGAVRAYQLSVGAQPTGMATARLQRMIAGDDSVTGCSVVLRRGMESPAVSAMQHSLSSLQYYDGSCDGSFDEATAEALRRFTRANGFLESTIATPAVQRAILEQYLDCEEKYGGNNYILHLCREGTAAVFTARSSRDTTSVVFGTDSGAPEGDGNHDYAYRLTQMGLAGGSCEPVESETTELTVELSFEPLDLPDDAPASSRVTSSAM